MMLLWLVMELMMVGGLAFLFFSVKTMMVNDKSRIAQQFIQVRQTEIASEQEVGRLTAGEAETLLKDLQAEAESTALPKLSPRSHRLTVIRVLFSTKYVCLAMFSVIVLGSVILYQSLGYSKDVAFTQSLAMKTNTAKSTLDFLAYRSRRYDRAEDWYYEANELMAASQYTKAVAGFKKALSRLPEGSPDRAEVLGKYAQAVFYKNGNISTPEMDELVKQALSLEPKNATSLGLRGISAFDHKEYLQAVLAWQDAARYNDNATERQTLLGAIQSARQAGNISYQQVPALVTQQISLKILWDKKVTWHSDDVLLVYAVVSGQKMPIAIRRVYPEDFDRPITLTNLDNLMSKMSLEDVDKVDLIVKLSKSSAKDLTKGKIIGIKKAIYSNTKTIYAINVTL